MTNVESPTVNRGQFLRNSAKGGLVLATAGGVLASVEGVAFAKGGPTKSDIAILQVGYIAESLAVHIYSTIIKDFHAFKGLKNKDYFVAALKDEQAHRDAWKAALGPRHTPTGFKLHIPAAAVKSTHALTTTGAALEQAFVATYLGAVEKFSSTELKVIAAGVAANEATHYSFFDAAAGGHAVLPAFNKPQAAAKSAAELKALGFIS